MYDPFLAICAAGLGAILGSFLNALSFRFNTGQGMGGRSHCMRCGHTLAAIDLVPIFSWLFLFGRCRYCKTRISAQYPLVEVLAAGLSVGVYVLHPTPLAYAVSLLVWLTILFIVVYDMRHTVIPWSCSGTLVLLSLATIALAWPPSFAALYAGPLLALPLFLLSLVSMGRWMGWGDSAFEISLGWLLGLSAGFTALLVAVWSGALVGILLMLFSSIPWKSGGKRFTMKNEIPFAPFLAFGAFLVYFFHVNFFSSLSLF